jgi:hypothetical protein
MSYTPRICIEEGLVMKTAKIESDYSTSKLSIIQTDDGDIIVSLYDRGEFRIATSGGRFHGQRLSDIVNKFSELIDLLNEEEV